MTILNDMLARHASQMSEKDVKILTNLVRRETQIDEDTNATNTDVDSVGFAKIERIYSATPVALFGQEAPSLAHSKLTLRRAHQTPNGYEPGDIVLAALISEQALTRLMFSTNKGSNNIPATAVQLGNTSLPKYVKDANAAEEAYTHSQNYVKKKISTVLSSLKEATSAGGSVTARKAAMESLKGLQSVVKNHGETSFFVEKRLETYSKKRTDLISEAAHAALHRDKILAQTPLLEDRTNAFDPEEERQTNPLLDVMLDRLNKEEEATLQTVMRLEAEWIKTTHNLSASYFGKNNEEWPQDRNMIGISDDAKKCVQNTRGWANDVFNKHVVEGRHQLTPFGLGMGVSQTQGWTKFLHSSLPATDDTYFNIRIAAAYETGKRGDSEIRGGHSPITEFSMTSDDMMMLLRGHPMGHDVPCSFRSLNAVWVAQGDAKTHEIENVAKTVTQDMTNDPRTQDLKKALQDLSEHMTISGGGKTWKAETDIKMSHIETLVNEYQNVIQSGFETADQGLRSGVGKMVRSSLEDMQSALPPELARKLLS
jgi:hypothetical protein